MAIAYDASKEGDPTAVSRRVLAFVKQLSVEKLSILGGIFEGHIVGQEEMRAIADIPPLHALRGMFVNVINSPIAGLAVAIKAIADKRSA